MTEPCTWLLVEDDSIDVRACSGPCGLEQRYKLSVAPMAAMPWTCCRRPILPGPPSVVLLDLNLPRMEAWISWPICARTLS